MPRLPPLLFLLLALLPVSLSQRCERHAHCATAEPALLRFCAPRHRRCVTLPHSSRQGADVPPDDEPFAVTLDELLNLTNSVDLSVGDKLDIIDAVKVVYNNVNPHRFLHENFLKIDFPAALDAIAPTDDMTNAQFYGNMTNAFQLMDDKHSLFLTPYPLNVSYALLGFTARKFYEPASTERHYIVSEVVDQLIPADSPFGVGAELLTVDGVPIDNHILLQGNNSYGSNFAAKVDTAIQLLSIRLLAGDLIPFNPSVDFVYLTPDGAKKSITLPWVFVVDQAQELEDGIVGHVHRATYTQLDRAVSPPPFTEEEKQRLFADVAPEPLDVSTHVVKEGRVPIAVSEEFKERFSAEIILTKSGPIGRFVIPDFGTTVTLELALEIARILRLMPQTGLIMDLRGNAGGSPDYVKLLAESLVSETVPPNPTTVRATAVMNRSLSLVDELGMLDPSGDLLAFQQYFAAVGTAITVGEAFTGPSADLYLARFSERFAPRAYFGPVVTLVDGLCYSGGDLFTSLQKDYKYSPVVGVSDNVGAGGASTLMYSLLAEVNGEDFKPVAAEFTTSFSRFYRSGRSAGAILENFGVPPDVRYFETRKDATMNDCDLYEFLGEMLIGMDEDGEEAGASPEPFDLGALEVSPFPEEVPPTEEPSIPEVGPVVV